MKRKVLSINADYKRLSMDIESESADVNNETERSILGGLH
jgi:hypothetical protein